MMHHCPLCREQSRDLFFSDQKREFFRCPRCGLVFVPEIHHLSEKEEKERYDLHENTRENRGYVDYLAGIAGTILDHVKIPGRGLDFGSGPEPVFAGILRDRGFDMDLYDPFYAPDLSVFRRKYDLITLVEVIEHLRDPLGELRRLSECLQPDGVMAIRTEMMPVKEDDFRSWSYKNDLTHICFFSSGTFRWLAGEIFSGLKFPAPQLVLLSPV